jgi:hypothetical protein
MAGVAVVASGNYDLEIETGFLVDAFTLDDPLRGLLNDTQYVLDGTTEFASVLDGINQVFVRRGRRDQGDQFGAGTMTFTMLDTDGIFMPFDEDSPYYDTAEAKPGLAPMRSVRLSRYSATNVKEYLFVGKIVNYDYNFALGGLDTVTVFCADDFYLLSQTYLDQYNVSEELSSVRVSAILDRPEVAFPVANRSIGTGTQTLGGNAAFTIAQGTNVFGYLAQVNEAEQGRLYMSREGDIVFEPRIGVTLDPSVADFHDDGTKIPYNGVGITFEADQVVNRAVVQILGSNNPQIVDDAGSQATYFIQTYSITNSLLHNDTAALELATYLLDPNPEPRYTSLATGFPLLTSAQRDTLAVLDIGDTITIEKSFAPGTNPASLAQSLSIEGIEHTININSGHSVTYYTSPVIVLNELILDDPTFGILSADNALG